MGRRQINGTEMPPKLDVNGDTGRINVTAPEALLERVEQWRRQQPKIPNKALAARMLIEWALDEMERQAHEKPEDSTS